MSTRKIKNNNNDNSNTVDSKKTVKWEIYDCCINKIASL